ncbi:hypothetical protein [Halobaculum sp. D14]|uniref:hypothetical protein n=1 Tax=Halobaculum sp. D14 TaxID=3421642 RepID=UPI003EB76E26
MDLDWENPWLFIPLITAIATLFYYVVGVWVFQEDWFTTAIPGFACGLTVGIVLYFSNSNAE